MYAISGGSLPLAMHIENSEQAGFAVFNHTRMHRIRLCGIGTNIHNDTGEASPNTAFLHCLGDPIETVAMGKHRFEECGRPGLQHFGYTQACTHITIVLSEVALQDPDTITEPLDESHVVCATSNQGLGQMNVSIDQTRDDEFSPHIDYFLVVVLALQCFGFPNGNDAVPLYSDGSVGDDVASGVHGDDGGISE
jgi:hypothetical protein